MTIRVAIIGAGPAGFYTAEALTNLDADTEIDLIEYLPAPYGLIRAGVAPDHQTTKKIQKSYAKTALKPEIRYYGNVKVGREASLDELRAVAARGVERRRAHRARRLERQARRRAAQQRIAHRGR